jgi:hypothetical protein
LPSARAARAAITDVLSVFGAGLLMLGLVPVFVTYVADPLTNRLARAPELLIGIGHGARHLGLHDRGRRPPTRSDQRWQG